MTRIPALLPENMTDHQKQVYDTIVSGPRGAVRGPLAVWLNRPELAESAQALGRYCRFDSSLPPRLSELAILTTARFWSSQFEWTAHKPIALNAGLSPAVIEAIRTNQEPDFEHEDEAVVYAFSKMLHNKHHIDSTLYEQAIALLGEEAIVDLTGILGYYTLISMTINVFEVPVPDETTPELN